MKITEIKWGEGKKYKHDNKIWTVEYSNLINDDGEDLANISDLMLIINGDFEEVIEPVDFLTAYKDCEDNDATYIDQMNPKVKLYGYDGRVTIIDDKKYGNTTALTVKWIKQ